MTDEINFGTLPDEPITYQIRVRGQLGIEWADWFGGLTVTLDDDGDTLLTGPVVRQAALHGSFIRACDVGVPSLSVTSLESGHDDAPGASQ